MTLVVERKGNWRHVGGCWRIVWEAFGRVFAIFLIFQNFLFSLLIYVYRKENKRIERKDVEGRKNKRDGFNEWIVEREKEALKYVTLQKHVWGRTSLKN